MENELQDAYQIGEVAELVGLSLRTIRHYEEVGLVPPSGRTTGGFRLYTDQDVERLQLVKQMKPLGFTLEEMRELLELREQLSAPGRSVAKRSDVHKRLAMFATAADERCERLREELQQAESFARTLRRQSPRPKREQSRSAR